jgi:hypothetical protein
MLNAISYLTRQQKAELIKLYHWRVLPLVHYHAIISDFKQWYVEHFVVKKKRLNDLFRLIQMDTSILSNKNTSENKKTTNAPNIAPA